MTATLRRTIFAGCRSLGIDEETRHDMQRALTGKESLSAMTEAELKLVVDHLRERGFERKNARRPQASDRRIRLIHVLWRKLGEAGELRDTSRKGLNAFIRSRFEKNWGSVPVDIDQLREPLQIDDVVQALKAWGQRAGIDFDWKDHRR